MLSGQMDELVQKIFTSGSIGGTSKIKQNLNMVDGSQLPL